MEAVLRSARVAYLSDLWIKKGFSFRKREEEHHAISLTSREECDGRCTLMHW